MFTHQFFDLLLNLTDDWQVKDVRADYKNNEVFIDIKHIGNKKFLSDKSEGTVIYDHAPRRTWRHLDTMQYKTYINCSLPRIKDTHGKVITITPPWASKHDRHTYLFEHAVIDVLLATKNQTKTANLMRCSFNVVNRIIHNGTKRGLERRDLPKQDIKHLSLDEKSFKKGHTYVSVLSDPEKKIILDIELNRKKTSVKRLFDKTLTQAQKDSIETISVDMWKPYLIKSQEELPNVDIVHDRFHLIKYLNDGIDKVRRREVKEHDDLKKTRFVLLKNKANLTDKQHIIFEAIKEANYEVSKAWQVRENFRDLFQLKSEYFDGFIMFFNWAQDAMNKNIKEINKVVEMFKGHFKGVINSLTKKQNNGMAERLNGKIQEIKTIGRGYRTFENFRSAILFFNGGLSLYPLK